MHDNWGYRGDNQYPLREKKQITTETITESGDITAYEYTKALKDTLSNWTKVGPFPFGNTTWSSGSFPSSRTFDPGDTKVVETEDGPPTATSTYSDKKNHLEVSQ